MKFNPRPYQKRSIDFVLNNPLSALFLDMGLGKTVSVLTAFDKLKYDRGEVQSLLVIAPLRVALLTWRQEAAKWDHLRHLRVNLIHGPEKQKALEAQADVYVINYDGLLWLKEIAASTTRRSTLPCIDMVVFDESTFIKNNSAKRTKVCRTLFRNTPKKTILTGTPMPNSLQDIWSQIVVLDGGQRLGSTFSFFKKQHFISGGYGGYQLFPVRGATERVTELISDISLTMKAEDYLEMPEEIVNQVNVCLPKKQKELYEEFEKKFFLELENEDEIEAFNSASLAMKLRQFTQGFIYDEDGVAHELHTKKIEALEEIIDNTGSPILIAFQFKHEVKTLTDKFPDMKFIYGDTKPADTIKYIDKWNKRELRYLAVHPASMSHGVNAQAGGNVIVWYGLSYSYEQISQLNARLVRQGQEASTVIIHYLIMEDTIDEAIMAAIKDKEKGQDKFLDYMRRRRNEKKENTGTRY